MSHCSFCHYADDLYVHETERKWIMDVCVCMSVCKSGLKEGKMEGKREDGKCGETGQEAAHLLASSPFKCWKTKAKEKYSCRIFNSSKNPRCFNKLNILWRNVLIANKIVFIWVFISPLSTFTMDVFLSVWPTFKEVSHVKTLLLPQR